MSDRIEPITPAYRGVMIASTPGVVWWGRLQVTGLEVLPLEGPLLVVGDHDSYWDTVAAGIAAMGRRQIRALAKSSLWKNKLLGWVLTGMGQIPIERGAGDSGALDPAIEELRKGACIGIYPEGTRSVGRVLRARSGVGYVARAVPEAKVVGVACNGTVAIPRFPTARPHVQVEFFEFDRPAIAPDESPQQYSTRLLAQLRQRAPIEVAGRKRAAALVGRVPTWSPELAITGRPGGKGALEEALAQTASKHGSLPVSSRAVAFHRRLASLVRVGITPATSAGRADVCGRVHGHVLGVVRLCATRQRRRAAKASRRERLAAVLEHAGGA